MFLVEQTGTPCDRLVPYPQYDNVSWCLAEGNETEDRC